MFRSLCFALAFACLATPLHAAQPQFLRIEGARDFLDGDSEGVSVDSEGRLRLAPASKLLHDTEAPFVWCLARDGKGNLYAGTGNDGKVFRVDHDGKTSLFFDAPELEIHALAIGPEDRLYVGSSPDGKVYAVDEGVGRPFYDPDDKYIWAMAFDASGKLLVATGAEGRLHRVDEKGTGQVVLTAADMHLVSLVVAGKDVYAGSSPSGIVYRLDAAGKSFVLHDSPYREVKALAAGKDGSLYAVAVDAKERDEARPAPAPAPTPAPAAVTPEVTITESFSLLPQMPPPAPGPRSADAARAAAQKGALLRILPTGEVDTLWSSADEMPHALLKAAGSALVATGNKGKLFEIHDDRTWSMLGSFPGEQLTALLPGEDGAVFFATSNPGKLLRLGAKPGERGTFTSKVKDTDTLSTWGRIRWEAELAGGTSVEITTRSGNTSAPDATWSDWSPAYTQKDGDPIVSERARFLQVRAVLVGKGSATPVLDTVSAAYLQRNLRPQVQSITAYGPGEIFQKPVSVTGELEVLGFEPGEAPEIRPASQTPRPLTMSPTAYSRKLYQRGLQTFQWKADDPNGDALVYDVQYRAVGDTRLRLLRKGTSDTVLAWDTSTVPNGRYLIRVTARDTPGNPEALALAGDKESAPFDVDNTPPTVSLVAGGGSPVRVRAVVRDDMSLLRKAEFTVDGGRWQEVHPTDAINDAREETYEITPAALPEPGPHILVVRATDLLGNVATARIEIK